jgi:hypothetical protein
MAGVGPFAGLGGAGALSIRRRFWEVALTMFGHHPVVGVGMNAFGDYFRFYRSTDVVRDLGVVDAPDQPHSVPIAMFANGGVLLGLSYLAFVGAVGYLLIRALRRQGGAEVQLTAAFGAAWVAFQVQSLVSVDVVPLATLHFVLAGAIVSRGGLAARTVRLGQASNQRRNAPSRDSVPAPLATVLAGVAGVVLAWFAIQPLRADVHSAAATRATARGDNQTALTQLQHATSEASWQGVYWLQRSRADGAVGDVRQGLADLQHALDANPRNVDAATSLARVEAAIHDNSAAAKYYRIALRLDPQNPVLKDGLSTAENNK